MTKRIAVVSLIVLFGVLLTLLCSYNRTETAITSLICCREFSKWTEEVMIADGNAITVNHRHSRDPYISFGHLGGVGSGDDHFSVAEFSAPPQRFRWAVARDERPIVLRLHEGRPWLVTFDRTDMGNIRFRFYTFAGNGFATEIAPDNFPRQLAIQNMWLTNENGYRDGKPVNEYEIVAALDPASPDFQRSLTAKMWLCLGKGIRYESNGANPTFLGEYKEKYLK